MTIRSAAVIGSGVMGGGIAAQIANAGVPVLLLDIVPQGAEERSALAKAALARLAKADPAAFMSRAAAALVTAGNLEDDLARLGEVDWIVEAVVEDLGIKRALYEKLEGARKPGSVVSSNTSTLPLAALTQGLPERFCRDFLITHFFNPPRYMRLLEVVRGDRTDPEAVARIAAFADRALGKSVIFCKDTPGFIANRIGCYWMQAAFKCAFEMGLSVEEADAVMGRPLGIPKTGLFGLADLVGIDLLPHVAASLRRSLPPDDAFHAVDRDWPLIRKLIETGYTGRKGKGGFYRLNTAGGERVKEAIDLQSGEYHAARKPRLDALSAAETGGARALLEGTEPAACFAWQVMARTLAYAASLVPEIADDIVAVDRAMRLGYNMKWGPFELLDRIGPAWFRARLEAEGLDVPPLLQAVGEGSFYRVEDGRLQHLRPVGGYADVERPDGVLLLEDVKRRSEPVAKNASASLWDIGDGVLCLEFHSKMNAIDLDTLAMVDKAIAIVAKAYKALVVYNEGSNFSVGANIGIALFAANAAVWPMIEDTVAKGQQTYRKLKHSGFPVVAAPSGIALGGGCEICLNADAVQAHAETYMGLVEVGVGLVPAWTGTTEMLSRWVRRKDRPGGPMPPIAQAFETIGMAKVAKSAAEAKELLLLRDGDGITMNRDRLLGDAKARALAMVEGYAPPETVPIALPGPTARAALDMAVRDLRRKGTATAHDQVVARQLAVVLSGGDTDITETVGDYDLLKLERAAFMTLVREPATLARMEHMLETGKPLRN
ncbi:MAG TPA: 3-hydroxyacyl-CoA dehydrogenase NAD-binding domain-containing protein [Geminicoccaceae bacterium]|nr:3-hydroxyacyl-CoA dehydrogenase NAD-binding domain-containing protein [Geminicoccaceae bacterium]